MLNILTLSSPTKEMKEKRQPLFLHLIIKKQWRNCLVGVKKTKIMKKKNITNENLLTFIHIEKPRTLNRAAKQKRPVNSKKLELASSGVKNKLYNLLPTCLRKDTSFSQTPHLSNECTNTGACRDCNYPAETVFMELRSITIITR